MSVHTHVRGSLIPQMTLARDFGLIAAGAALTTLAAQIQIPWQPVPFTMQTLAVAICGLALGARRGVMSQLAYLGAGVAGLPVFAKGKFGPAVLIEPTGGFLVAFVVVAWLLGSLADRGLDRKPKSLAAGMLLANFVLFGLGWAWLSVLIGGKAAFMAGVLPFLGSEIIKDVMAVVALPLAWRFVGRR